jgi:hypothetical protein
MKHLSFYLLNTFIFVFFFTGCATVIKGYEDRVSLINAPEGMQVFNKDGIEIPILNKIGRTYSHTQNKYIDTCYGKIIYLRSDKDQLLTFRYNGREQKVERYPRIGGGWCILDALTVFPLFIDAYTGSWNHFEPIQINF